MIIVSQNKDVIVNFYNIESIDIVADLDGTGEVPYKIYYETSAKREELGKYKTEERAKEVLQKIIGTYDLTMIRLGKTFVSLNKYDYVYEMPRD